MNPIRQKAEMLAMFGTVIQLNRVSRLYVPSNEVYSIGWQVFDKALDGGLRDGELITISGQTGQGKTLTAQNLAYNFSKNNIPSLFFSYEMNPYYLMENFKKIIRDVSPYDLLVYSPIELYERDLKFVEQEIKEGVEEKAIKVVFIDHLHYLIDLKSSLNSSLLIGGIVRELKQMAVRNNVIIFLIAHTKKIYQDEQLSLSSLRDSSFISQESDYVFLVERKKKSLKERLENEGRAEGTEWTNQTRITLAKNRRTGKMFFVDFNFQDNKLILIDKMYGKQQSF
ncbi:MAG: AAA family ATPase [Methanosarcinales archaeon]|nr:AAA family ATPase [Methanosarcinales archaeon]